MRRLSLVLALVLFACSNSRGAFPVDIPTTLQGYDVGNVAKGKFGYVVGANEYLFLRRGGTNTSIGDAKVHALKSTDGGNTWVEKDSANAAAVTNISRFTGNYTVARDGDKILVLGVVAHTAGGTTVVVDGINVWNFTLSTDTWSGPTLIATIKPDFMCKGAFTTCDGTTSGATQVFIALAVIGTNNYVMLYSGPQETKLGRAYYVTFNGTTFGAPAALPGQAASPVFWFPVDTIADAAGRVHLFYLNNVQATAFGFPFIHSVLSGGVITSTENVTTLGDFYGVIGNFSDPVIYTVGGVETIAVAGQVWSDGMGTTEEIASFTSPTAGPYTWTQNIVTTTTNLAVDEEFAIIPRLFTLVESNSTVGLVGMSIAAFNPNLGDELAQFFGQTKVSPTLTLLWTVTSGADNSSFFTATSATSPIAWGGVADLFDASQPFFPATQVVSMAVIAAAPPPVVTTLQNYVMSDNPNFLQKTNFIRSN